MADGNITVARAASMEELRKSVAELLGEPADWPDHGNAPLAIAATMALLHEGCKRLEAENAALKREAHEWWTAARDATKAATDLWQQIGAEVDRLHSEATKSERRAITFGDIVQSQVIAMRAAVVAAKLEGLDVGMQWIANTLEGPGHLPDLDEARALGGAQALWDKETAEAEAFRAAHPAP